MERARLRTHKVRTETMAFVALLTRMYDAHRCLAARPQSDGRYETVVCVHTPAGQLAWKLTDDEAVRFAALPERANDWDKHTDSARIARLDRLTPALR